MKDKVRKRREKTKWAPSHLHSGLCELQPVGQGFPGVDIRVVGDEECSLQLRDLPRGEVRPVSGTGGACRSVWHYNKLVGQENTFLNGENIKVVLC